MEIFTDGACSGNPGNGGFGIVIVNGKTITEYQSKCFHNVTNNQMELSAIITALKLLKHNNVTGNVTLYSDSEYCVNSITKWLNTWIKNNYNIGSKKEIKNIPLWEEFRKLRDSINCKVEYLWVKGHENNEFNNLADQNAVSAKKSGLDHSVVNTYEKE